jgi:hypothetical protein
MPAQYDPIIIQKFADRLYARAISAIAGSVLGGVILGVGIGVLVYILTNETMRWGLIRLMCWPSWTCTLFSVVR